MCSDECFHALRRSSPDAEDPKSDFFELIMVEEKSAIKDRSWFLHSQEHFFIIVILKFIPFCQNDNRMGIFYSFVGILENINQLLNSFLGRDQSEFISDHSLGDFGVIDTQMSPFF